MRDGIVGASLRYEKGLQMLSRVAERKAVIYRKPLSRGNVRGNLPTTDFVILGVRGVRVRSLCACVPELRVNPCTLTPSLCARRARTHVRVRAPPCARA